MELQDAINERKSVHRFSDKKPDWRDILEVIDTARHAPMAGNDFILKFVTVFDPKVIEKIADACQQPFVGEAQYLIVVCSDTKRATNQFGEKADMFVRQQAGAAIQNMLLSITEKGLATCWVGYFVEEQVKREIKVIPPTVQIEAILPIGYESKAQEHKKVKKKKIDLENVLFFNKWGEQKMRPPKKVLT
ncbi:Coenzyme F420:L-glutamate ligase [uncultured archaeon]|nr:Coenzyme F420:L-glutamate ligase [uncultured archaeon]